MKSTEQIAQRLVEFCRQGKYEDAQKELYSNDAVSIEPEDSPGLQNVKGLDAIIQKGHQFQSMVEEVHSNTVSEPIIAGNTFAVVAVLDITMKGMGRVPMQELAVYEVKDGKLGRMLRDVAYQSNTTDFWENCDAVCDKTEYMLGGAMNDGKGEPMQSNPVSHGCSPARFTKIKVINTRAQSANARTNMLAMWL